MTCLHVCNSTSGAAGPPQRAAGEKIFNKHASKSLIWVRLSATADRGRDLGTTPLERRGTRISRETRAAAATNAAATPAAAAAALLLLLLLLRRRRRRRRRKHHPRLDRLSRSAAGSPPSSHTPLAEQNPNASTDSLQHARARQQQRHEQQWNVTVPPCPPQAKQIFADAARSQNPAK